MPTEITIAGRHIGLGNPVYVIAELSANHNQNFDQAVRIVHAAKECGADAVKLQTYTADTITLRSDKECFRIAGGTLWDGRTLHDLYREAFTPWEWQPKLKQIASDLGMHFFSSAFDDSAVDFLEQMNVPAHKVASFELVDIGLIQKMARTGKPLIMSTGMASEAEIAEAVEAARNAGASQIALLKCTSAYPARQTKRTCARFLNWRAASFVPSGYPTTRWASPFQSSRWPWELASSKSISACAARMAAPTAPSPWNPKSSRRWSTLFASPRSLSVRRNSPRHRGSKQPQVPALAVRSRRCKEGRSVYPKERAFDSSRRRAAPAASRGSSWANARPATGSAERR